MTQRKRRLPCCQVSYKAGYISGLAAARQGFHVQLDSCAFAPFGKPLPWADAVQSVYLDTAGREHIEYA